MFGKKKIAGTVLFVSCLATYQRKNVIEKCKSVEAGAYKVGKVVFPPNLILIFLIFGEREKCQSYILKKAGLNTIKEIL